MSPDWTSVALEGACIGGLSVAWRKRRHADLSRKSFWGFVLPLAAYVPISIGILLVGTKSNILAGVTMAGFLAVLLGAILSFQGLFERPESGNRRLNFGFGLGSWVAISLLWVTPWAQGIGMASADSVPPKSSTTAKATLATSYSSKLFHYSIDLSEAGWKRVDPTGSNFDAADLLVIHGNSFLAIGAVDLHGIDLSLDMLARGVAMEPDRKQKMPETQDVERSENEITFIQDAVKANDYKQRCRVVKGHGIAWVLVGQWHTSHNELALEVKNAIARFKPETDLSGAPFRPEDLTPLQRRG
jgi:hypothetical protein